PERLAPLPIDHGVGVVPTRGGARAAAAALRRFVDDRLDGYGDRNHPDAATASGLSPYLHFGHIGAHQVFAAIALREDWQRNRIRTAVDGQKGWYGMREPAEEFLDQLVTWRELGFNASWQRDDHDRFTAVPEWAQATLAAHRDDPREQLYGIDDLAAGRSADPLWNAAQRELRETGALHNYLRMLWGKRVLGWSADPAAAFATLVELNDRYALDGRDPNSYSGIGWVFGRYDRPWAPERPVFGRVRFMSSANTLRKLRLKGYLARFGG
ncbi:MAG: deoxyribodipyrimidine photolyase, partial [Planctomycetes bacterium]|nr:deoxyribodipyrimidine photolyase [Planctomycetota bacterium]